MLPDPLPTLGRVSNPDDVSSRLSNALDEILKGAPPKLPEREPRPAGGLDDPYVLPEIVPATETPVLPDTTRVVPPPWGLW